MQSEKKTKKEIVSDIYNKCDSKIEKQHIMEVVDLFLDEVKNDLIDGSVIELRGFGTFEPRLRKEKNSARNPKTGEICKIKPHYIAAFRAGQELKEKIWNLELNDEKETE